MAKIAEGVVVDYTVFRQALLTPSEVLLLLNNARERHKQAAHSLKCQA